MWAYGEKIADIDYIDNEHTRVRLYRSPIVSATIIRRYNDIMRICGVRSSVHILKGKLLIDDDLFGEVVTLYTNGKPETEEDRHDCV